jgi:hypothetical protein
MRKNSLIKNSWSISLSVLLMVIIPLGKVLSASETIKVSWDPVLVRPGGVIPVIVTTPTELERVETISVNGKFPLIKNENGEHIALVGIASIFKGPVYHLDFHLFSKDASDPYIIDAELKLPVKAGKPARKQALSVPTKMVHLSEKKLTQVQLDSRSFWKILRERTPERYWRDSFRLPLKGRISARFGVRRVLNGVPKRPHGGIDIAAPKGSTISAANRGVVAMAVEFYLLGRTVVLDHGWGVYTVYAHLDSINVLEGQLLEPGQFLGRVGTSGRVTGPHLHFGTFIRGAKVNPEQLIKVTKDF